jgi:hypothetical protein
MALHIERLTSEVSLQEGGGALSPEQVEQLVSLVIKRLEDRAREAERSRNATRLHRHLHPPLEPGV